MDWRNLKWHFVQNVAHRLTEKNFVPHAELRSSISRREHPGQCTER